MPDTPNAPIPPNAPVAALDHEYAQLRATIRTRGSLRVGLVVGVLAVWALMTALGAAFVLLPLAALPPLIVLMAGFEAAYALHVGVERIGRYLYARYEAGVTPLLWEGAIAAFGAGHRSTMRPTDALFTSYFVMAVVLNGLMGALGATPPERVALALAHAAALLRILMAKRTLAKQRDEDLARFANVLLPR